MCGIAGFMGRGDRESLLRMTKKIAHRGPDDEGQWFEDGIGGLGHTRLSIVDLSPRGHQPMWNREKTVGIVFNGEIYNFKELRARLEKEKGYRFQSDSDTEAIIALYEEKGIDAFSDLVGQFALALYDRRSDTIHLVRDRIGEKPLYYADLGHTLVFGSEIRALLEYPGINRDIDREALAHYLVLEYVPTPLSLFKGISKLEPGVVLSWCRGSASKKTFWSLDLERNSEDTLEEGMSRLDALLADSVERQLVADVPVGVFLSGGIDSGAVAYYAARVRGTDLKTFSIGFSEPSFDESSYARRVASHLSTDHHERIVSAEDALAVVSKLSTVFDEPLADSSAIPTYLLSGFARESVKVVLGGDGGDELFAGYPTFQADRFASHLAMIPSSVRDSVLLPLSRHLPQSEKNFGFAFKTEKFMEGLGRTALRRHQAWLSAFTPETRQRLAPSLEAPRHPPLAEDMMSGEAYMLGLNQILYAYLRSYLLDGVLVKVDRASMAHALEVRAPFLDHRLVEYAFSLPAHMKLRGNTTKYILKKLMDGKLPHEIIHRQKKGFGIPLARWLRHELKEYLLETLSESRVKSTGIFDSKYVEVLKREHLDGKRDHRKKLWTLLMYFEWENKYLHV